MPTWPNATIAGPLGVQADPEFAVVITRISGGVSLGSLVMFDLTQTDADVSNGLPGDENSVFANVIAPTTALLSFGWYGVVTDLRGGTGAEGEEVKVCIRGRCKALVSGTNAAAVTDPLAAVNAQTSLDSDALAAGEKVLGFPLETTAGGTAELIDVIFDGIAGFGNAPDQ